MNLLINNSEYEVLFVEPDSPFLRNGECLGMCYTTTKIIAINDRLKHQQDVLRHEITHAVIYEYLAVDAVWNTEKVCEFIQRYYRIIEELVSRAYNRPLGYGDGGHND